MIRTAILAGIVLSGSLARAGEISRELRTFFTDQIGLSGNEIRAVAQGTVVAKMLPSRTPAEIFVFGAVFVNATPEEYVKLAFNVNVLRKLPNYLGIGRISDRPALFDLEGFTLEPEDIRSLKDCRPGKCEVQLPAESMQQLQKTVDWTSPNAATQINGWLRKMAIDFLQRYQKSGNSVLLTYRDKDRPFDVSAQLQSWLGRSKALPIYLPELNRYLLDYPKAKPANVESLFYWEKVDFGLKPTLRLNHAMAFRPTGLKEPACVVAVKQLYASHYFQFALDLTACVTGRGPANGKGFYLISLKGSTQQGLTGIRGSLLRKIVVSKTHSAQEKALIGIKRALESRR